MKIGIIYNWKGLKEENYLYTLDEMAEYDFELLQDCLNNPEEWFDSTKIECGWKTWMGKLLKTDDEVRDFLNGHHNDILRSDEDPDWYWENVVDNDLYGEKSKTLVQYGIIKGKLCCN